MSGGSWRNRCRNPDRLKRHSAAMSRPARGASASPASARQADGDLGNLIWSRLAAPAHKTCPPPITHVSGLAFAHSK